MKLTRWELAALMLAGWALGMATFAVLAAVLAWSYGQL